MEFVWVPIIVSQITRAIKYTTTNLLWSTLFWKILKLELINRNFFTSFYMQCFSFQSYVFNISLTYNVLIRSNPELEFQTYQKNPHKFSCHMVGIFGWKIVYVSIFWPILLLIENIYSRVQKSIENLDFTFRPKMAIFFGEQEWGREGCHSHYLFNGCNFF